MRPRTTLVTESAGSIGGSVAALLRTQGERVMGLDLRESHVFADLATSNGRCAALAGVL